MNQQIKTIIFDWAGVCCKEGEPFASIPLQQALGLDPNQIAAEVKDLYDGFYIGKYTAEEFWQKVLQHFNLPETDQINSQALSQAYLESYSIYPQIFAKILELKAKYKIVLLSNLTPIMKDQIQSNHELDKYFEIQMFSCDLDLAAIKPTEQPYLYMLQKLGQKPAECLFIDDSAKNIATAQNLGFNTMRFISPEQFLADIKNYE